jgi:hypothetical protein
MRTIGFLVATGCLAVAPPSFATEGGATHYTPGAVATLIDLAPSKPGWVIAPAYLHYSADAGDFVQTPVIGQIALGLNVKSDTALLGGLYTFQEPVLGAHYTVGAYLPYAFVEVEATVSTEFGARARRDSASGLGDVTLVPAMLAWKSGPWQYNALVPIVAPTGSYKTDSLANPGLNDWSFDPTVGVSYDNDKTGFNAAVYAGLEVNTTNQDTDYRSGTLLHFDGSVQQLFSAGAGFLGIGAEAFYLNQVSGDSGRGARLGDFKGHPIGVGPLLTSVLPLAKDTLVAELRWLTEMSVTRRLDGDHVWRKFIYQF